MLCRRLTLRLVNVAAAFGLLAIQAVFLWTTPAAAADDWNTGAGGNASRDSFSSEQGPTAPDLLWQGSRPAIVAQQAAIEGDLVVMARIEDFTIPTGTWIVAHDLHTGVERWAIQLPCEFKDCWRSRLSAIRDGQVYATRAGNTNLDYLYALSPGDGSIIWRSKDLVDETTTESLAFTQEGDIIAANFNSLMRISRADGTTMWTNSRTCPTSNGCQAAVYGDRIYIFEASPNGPLISAFDADTGDALYSSPAIGGGFVQQVGPLVGPDGTVYAPRTQNNPVTDFFVAFDDTGSALVEKWRIPLGFVPFATFAIGPDGSVYMYQTPSDSELKMLRLDPANGSIVDESAIIRIDFPAVPRIAADRDGVIFFTNGGFSRGRLYSFNADLTQRWSVAIANVNVGGPAIGENGVLIVCGVGNDVRAFDTPEAGTPADLVGFFVATGTLLSGGLSDLTSSDDTYVQTRSGFGQSLADLHHMEMAISAESSVQSPVSVDLIFETRTSEPFGLARIQAFNWTGDFFETVGSFPLADADTINRIEDLDADSYIDTARDGNVDLLVKHIVFVPFLAFRFESFIDLVEIVVR